MFLLAACSPKSEPVPPTPAAPVTVAAAPVPVPVAVPVEQVVAATPKQQHLSSAEEKHIIQLTKDQVTSDGATVLQVLQHAEKMRPREFKVANWEVVYSGDGTPHVAVCYFSGSKRLPGDQYCDIGYAIAADHKSLAPEYGNLPIEMRAEMPLDALGQGRDSFLKSVDEHYQTDCVDYDTKKKMC